MLVQKRSQRSSWPYAFDVLSPAGADAATAAMTSGGAAAGFGINAPLAPAGGAYLRYTRETLASSYHCTRQAAHTSSMQARQ